MITVQFVAIQCSVCIIYSAFIAAAIMSPYLGLCALKFTYTSPLYGGTSYL